METKVYYSCGRYAVDVRHKGEKEFVSFAFVEYEKVESVLAHLKRLYG